LFETTNTIGIAMALQVNEVLSTYHLNVKIFPYVKNKGNNLSPMTFALIPFISCQVLGLTTPFVGSCWGHAMSKCFKYAIYDTKIYVGLTSISIQ
jgi:hypothetical protein